jgi:hypothetical protein
LSEESAARAAAGLLQIVVAGGEIDGSAIEREAKVKGKLGHETFIRIGLSASELMIEVGDSERDFQRRCQFEQNMQQADRIWSARDRDRDAATMRQHVITSNGFSNLLQHGELFPYCSGGCLNDGSKDSGTRGENSSAADGC